LINYLVLVPLLSLLAGTQAWTASPVGDFAEAHPQVDNMVVLQANLRENSPAPGDLSYFQQAIPKIIHQIWFGDPALFDEERGKEWMDIAERYGYSYHLWTEDDDPTIEALFGLETLKYIQILRARNRYAAASDVLRYHLIAEFGGMYFDNDVPGPKRDGRLLDPVALWPMKGLILVGENDAREVKNSAFFVVNAIIMAPPHNPVIEALAQSLLANLDAQPLNFERWASGAYFLTGQALMTATIKGTFTFLPNEYLEHLEMNFWPDRPQYEDRIREKYNQKKEKADRITSIHQIR
jgi:mannosyltransferase OCH1-like enzyme